MADKFVKPKFHYLVLKKIIGVVFTACILLVCVINFNIFLARAEPLAQIQTDQTKAFVDATSLSQNLTVTGIIATLIQVFLGFLGIIFLVLMIMAGYNWMTAGGDEEKVKKATSTIKRALMGIIIVVSAYAITAFVFKNLPGSGITGSSGGSLQGEDLY